MFMQKKLLPKRMLYISYYLLFCIFALSIATYCYMLSFAMEITINDDGDIYLVESKAVYVADLLEEQGIEIRPFDRLSQSLGDPLEEDMHIYIKRAFPVVIKTEQGSFEHYTHAVTVWETLKELDFLLAGGFSVTPELNEPISPGENISILQHLTVMEVSLEDIPFAVEKTEDPNLLKGKITTLQEGTAGRRELTFKVVYAGDEELSREFIGECVIEEPVNSIVALGTKVSPSPSPLVIASRGESNEGIASWYGEQFHGKKTTSGEVFNQNEFTAAHRNLPFNTYVNVTFLKTGKSVLVRINDRGPGSRDRIIDLSRAAAEAIGLRPHGIGKVRIEVVDVKKN
ncbi:MAG: septal ring lytic transglycosylase RlpA family protein [Bacillota bacterium]|nr:septal ring lytic transglycosylase RlpA family protein [Bacillota bacterium]